MSSRKRTTRRTTHKRMAPRRHMAVGTSMVAPAVLGVVGTQTAASLLTKPRSSKLGAGMATMVSLTKKKVRSMAGKKRTTHKRRTTGTHKRRTVHRRRTTGTHKRRTVHRRRTGMAHRGMAHRMHAMAMSPRMAHHLALSPGF